MSRIAFISHTDRESVFKVGSFHLTRELARQGHDVAHISTPISLLHLVKGIDARKKALLEKGPTLSDDGVVDYIPRTVLPARWSWSRYQLRRALDRVGLGNPDYIFVDQPLLVAEFPSVSTVIFRPTDIKTHRIDAARAATLMARFAHGLAATSPIVRDSLPNPRHIPTTLIENGCEIARFSSYTERGDRRGFVYVGAMDSRFDLASVARLAEMHPTEPVDLYGPATEQVRGAAERLPNLTAHGPVSYGDVPAILQRARVGLLPFTRSESNRGRSPMKLYEYLAAGLVVLSSETVRASEAVTAVSFSYGDDAELRAASGSALRAMPDREAVLSSIATKDWSSNAERLIEFASGLSSFR